MATTAELLVALENLKDELASARTALEDIPGWAIRQKVTDQQLARKSEMLEKRIKTAEGAYQSARSKLYDHLAKTFPLSTNNF